MPRAVSAAVCVLLLAGHPRSVRVELARVLSCEAFAPGLAAADLEARFGRNSVTAAVIELGEGEQEQGSVLFAAAQKDKVEIVWKDAQARRFPKFVRIYGDASHWHAALGVTLGMPLRDVERLNRRPFRLTGFGFDGEGAVLSWAGGLLGEGGNDDCWVFVRLAAPWPADPRGQRIYRQVTGDKKFSSAHPAMQALNPAIREISLI